MIAWIIQNVGDNLRYLIATQSDPIKIKHQPNNKAKIIRYLCAFVTLLNRFYKYSINQSTTLELHKSYGHLLDFEGQMSIQYYCKNPTNQDK